MRIFPAVILAMALSSSLAFGQNIANTPSAAAAPITAAGQWRASKMVGVEVYNEENEKIGEINDIIIEPGGRIYGAVVSVGGFLGVGEHDVILPMSTMKFSNKAGTTTAGTTSSGSKQWYPDRAVVNTTKEGLKSMAEFKY